MMFFLPGARAGAAPKPKQAGSETLMKTYMKNHNKFQRNTVPYQVSLTCLFHYNNLQAMTIS